MPNGSSDTVSWRLERSYAQYDLDAARDARRVVRERTAVRRRVLDDLLIVVSELVTNAIRHAPRVTGGRIVLTVRGDQTHVHIAVRDPGPGFTLRQHDPAREGGLGLVAVARISSEWGVQVGDGTTVWCSIAIDD